MTCCQTEPSQYLNQCRLIVDEGLYNYHYSDGIMSAMVSKITGISIVCSNVSSGTDLGICQWPLWGESTWQWTVDSPQIVPETQKMLQFDDVMNEERESLKSAANRHDVITWKHFSRCWPFVRGIRRSPVNSPHKGQWRGALKISLICAWIKVWVNNREAGDLRHHRAHYDVIVINEIY